MGPQLAVILIIGCVVTVALFGYFYYRKVLREAKNYERGLKMVPLLIHLPPVSDDIEVGGRDAREVTGETISRAETLYNIIASVSTKGLKSKFYGQRHLAFEIVAADGVINYYAAVPVSLVDVVAQAVTTAYPSSRLEEVEEHNLFSEVGKISGTIGGELILKKKSAYPISTFQDSKSDAMQGILNSLSGMNREDGAGIQILIRPAGRDWARKVTATAHKIRKDKQLGRRSGTSSSIRGVGSALWKPPDSTGSTGSTGEKKPEKQLSTGEQALVDSIEEKARYAGYEVLIRLVASANTTTRSQSILNSMVASFALFDAKDRNGFKFIPARSMEAFVTAFIFRFFPPETNKSVLNSVELASVFHFPDQRSTPTSQLKRQASKQVDGPNNVPDHGLLLGHNEFRGIKKPIRLSNEDRRRHMYIIGQTGTGKSWFLKNLIMQDVYASRGLAFIDPHGDAAEDVLGMIPKERTEDVIYFAPGDLDNPVGLNLFEYELPEQRDFLIQEAINMLYKLYDPQRQGIIGPRYEHLFRNAAITVMSGPDGGTFIDIPKLFNDKAYVNQKLKYVTDQVTLDFWLKEMPQSERSNEFGEVKSWFVSKFGAFLSNEMMRNIIGQTKSGFNLRQLMDDGKILLVNLSKGKTGELNAKLLGMIFVMKFYAAAMGRANIPEDERRDFTLYVDEFQNFSTESFSDILSEARKYHLSLTVANQFVGQLTDDIRDAVFGNVGSVVSSRTGASDAEFLVKYFSPVFDTEDLTKMPNQQWAVQTLMNGVPTQAFSMNSVMSDLRPNPNLALALKQLSYAKYGKPRAVVEKDIFARLKTQPTQPQALAGLASAGLPNGGQVMRPSAGLAPSGLPVNPSTAPPAPMAQRPTSAANSSFLDDWLAKRKKDMANQKPAQLFSPAPSVGGVHPASAPSTTPILARSETVINTTKTHTPTPVVAPPVQVSMPAESELAEGEIIIDRQGLIHHGDQDV